VSPKAVPRQGRPVPVEREEERAARLRWLSVPKPVENSIVPELIDATVDRPNATLIVIYSTLQILQKRVQFLRPPCTFEKAACFSPYAHELALRTIL